jgi:DNA-binding NarL/FixJ family response regulator
VSEIKSENINILLAIPQEFLCNGIKAIFSRFEDIQIVGELDNFENLADSVKTQLPEILIISAGERNPFIFDLVKTIRISHPEVSVIVMLENYEDELIYASLCLSVSACLTTSVQSDELITCIRKVWHGENPIFDTLTRPGIARLIIKDMDSILTSDFTDPADTRKTLSDKEREILRLVANGNTLDQIILNINSTENDTIQHLTDIYGKLIFNNFCEFTAQPSDKSITQGQSTDANLVEENTNTQTAGLNTPEVNTEKEDDANTNGTQGEYITAAWEGFEVLKKELQETLDRLAPTDDSSRNTMEEEHEEFPVPDKEDITESTDADENIPEVMTVSHDHTAEDVEMLEQEYSSKSGEFSEEMQPTGEDEAHNIESDTNTFEVNEVDESGELPQDTPATVKELEVEENEEPVKQKSGWFRLSLRRNNKAGIKKNESPKNNDSPENTAASNKPELDPGEEPELAKDEKKTPKSLKGDSKHTTQTGHKYSQEEILSSVKGMGVPVFIKTPVDGKQLEKLESIIKKSDGLNIILHKGTVQEHILVISGRDPSSLLKILNDIPLVESSSDVNGIINIRLFPNTDMGDLSQVQ